MFLYGLLVITKQQYNTIIQYIQLELPRNLIRKCSFNVYQYFREAPKWLNYLFVKVRNLNSVQIVTSCGIMASYWLLSSRQVSFFSLGTKENMLKTFRRSVGCNVSSTESAVDMHISKAWTAIHRLSTIWKSDLEPSKTWIHQHCVDTGCSLEDVQKVIIFFKSIFLFLSEYMRIFSFCFYFDFLRSFSCRIDIFVFIWIICLNCQITAIKSKLKGHTGKNIYIYRIAIMVPQLFSYKGGFGTTYSICWYAMKQENQTKYIYLYTHNIICIR